MQRRRLLSSLIAASTIALVSGCSLRGGPPDDDYDGVPNSEDDYPNERGKSERVNSVDEIKAINEDETAEYSIQIDESATISLEVSLLEGPHIDIIFMTEDEYSKIDEDTVPDMISDVTRWEIKETSIHAELDPDDYRLIVDNTNAGKTVPPANFEDDVAVADIRFEVYR